MLDVSGRLHGDGARLDGIADDGTVGHTIAFDEGLRGDTDGVMTAVAPPLTPTAFDPPPARPAEIAAILALI